MPCGGRPSMSDRCGLHTQLNRATRGLHPLAGPSHEMAGKRGKLGAEGVCTGAVTGTLLQNCATCGAMSGRVHE
eukprot:1544866-Amphidinium_carterae.2